MLVFKNGCWKEEKPQNVKQDRVYFRDIWLYYANLVDYVRVVMILLATFSIRSAAPLTTAFLIIGSTLLDWIDGPVARAFGQCTMFGSGIDWLADILTQVVTLAWWVLLDPVVLPWVMLMTTIETATCLFDFATTATGTYPRYINRGGFFIILDYSMPNGTYSPFGTLLWLAYPVYAVACCLELSWSSLEVDPVTVFLLSATQYLLFIPTILYGWCELAYLAHIMCHWSEPGRGDGSNHKQVQETKQTTSIISPSKKTSNGKKLKTKSD